MMSSWMMRCAIIIALVGCVWQAAEANTDGIDAEVQPALTEMIRAYERAVASSSFDGLGPFLSKGFSAVTILGEEVSGIEQLKASNSRLMERVGGFERYDVEVVPALVQQISPELVLVSGITNDKLVSSGGHTFDFSTSWTAFGIKEDGTWKLRRVHAVVMEPFDNSFVRFLINGAKITYGLSAGLIGILLGGVFTALLIGRRTSSSKHNS